MSSKPDSEVKAMEAALNAVVTLETDEQRRVVAWLIDKLKLSLSLPGGNPAVRTAQGTASNLGVQAGITEGVTPKLFLAQKMPKTDAERVTCLAYFLTHSRGTPQFKTKVITQLNKEAAQPRFSNPAVAVSNAARDQYLAPAGKGEKQITVRGEAVVEALPDREAVRTALDTHSARKRKPGKNKHRKKA